MDKRLPETNPLPNPNESILTVPQEPRRPSGRERVMNKAALVALAIVGLAIAVMLFWLIEPSPPLEVKNSPFPARIVADPSGNTGGLAFLSVDYCKNTNKPGQVRVSYVSESREQLVPTTTEHLEKGCENREVPVVIPTNLSEDVYTIRFLVTYNLNPLKNNVTVEFESQPVNIRVVEE